MSFEISFEISCIKCSSIPQKITNTLLKIYKTSISRVFVSLFKTFYNILFLNTFTIDQIIQRLFPQYGFQYLPCIVPRQLFAENKFLRDFIWCYA